MKENDKAYDMHCFSAFLRKPLTVHLCFGCSVHLKQWVKDALGNSISDFAVVRTNKYDCIPCIL